MRPPPRPSLTRVGFPLGMAVETATPWPAAPALRRDSALRPDEPAAPNGEIVRAWQNRKTTRNAIKPSFCQLKHAFFAGMTALNAAERALFQSKNSLCHTKNSFFRSLSGPGRLSVRRRTRLRTPLAETRARHTGGSGRVGAGSAPRSAVSRGRRGVIRRGGAIGRSAC